MDKQKMAFLVQYKGRAYHVDKNTKCANRHRIMCSEITKILNGLLEAYS